MKPTIVFTALLAISAVAGAAQVAAAQGEEETPPVLVQAGRPAAAAAPAPDFVLVSRRDHSDTIATSDLPLTLVKAGRQEAALVRRAVFVSTALRVTRPADAPSPETCRWAYRSFLQRQVCFTSMSGLFACTQPEVLDLPDQAEGEARLSLDQSAAGACTDAFPPAAEASAQLIASLRTRATALFDADHHAKVEPVFKAAGVTVRPGKSQ